jgi:hypothetical protein
MRSRDPDARLAERALRESWPVPEEKRPELVAQLIDVAMDTKAKATPRERVSAIKVLLSASKLNLEALRVSMLAEEFEDLRERLRRLLEDSDEAGEGAGWG